MIRKLSLLPIFLWAFLSLHAQIVTTNPPIINASTTVVEVFFNATGTGLDGFKGDVYAHAGVITDLSKGDSDWKYAPAWLDNTTKYKLTSIANNLWKLTLSPNMRSYYGVPANEKILKLAFVFRNADGSKEGKDQGKDILVPINQSAALSLLFQTPANFSIFNLDQSVAIRFASSAPADLKLFVNTIDSPPIATALATQSLSCEYTTTQYTDLLFIAEASNSGITVRDTLKVVVLKPSETVARPSDLKEGIHIYGSKTSFLLYAPNKTNAALLGDFNDFKASNSQVMHRDGDFFWALIDGLDHTKEHAYQYLIDQSIRTVDPYVEKILDPWNDHYINQHAIIYPNLRSYPAGKTTDVVGCFQLIKSSFLWNDGNFNRPDQRNLVIYELLFRDFTTEGSVKAAMLKLDYLQNLGINAIELMPIQEFEGNDSWGYNPNFYFALDKAYGTPDDYKAFVNECHRRGIAVIIDVVYNHTWGQHPWCKLWYDESNNRPATNNPFYNSVATHPYSVGNDLNHANSRLRQYIADNLQFLIKEYHIDGFRFDLSKGFTQKNSGENVSLWGQYDTNRIGYIKQYVDAIKSIEPTAYAIMEHFAEDREENEIAAYKSTLLWRNMNHNFAQNAMGYSSSSDFSAISMRGRVGFMESHDEERLAYKTKNFGIKGVKGDSIAQFNRLISGAVFAFLMPESRMIWQFGELGYDVSIDHNGRTGRKPILWEYYNRPERRVIYDALARLINYRTQHAALFTDSLLTTTSKTSDKDWKEGRSLNLLSKNGNIVALYNPTLTPLSTILQFPHSGEWLDLVSGRIYFVPNKESYPISVAAHSSFAFVDSFSGNSTNETASQEKATCFFDKNRDILYLTTESPITTYDLYNLNGTLIRKGTKNYIPANELPRGIYFVKASTEKGKSHTFKILK